MLSDGLNDRLEAALETAMIVLMMRSRFSDGGMAAPVVNTRALNFVGA
jgi:hypothetical protein